MELEPINITFPPKWINASIFEDTLRRSQSPHETLSSTIYFRFPDKCRIMIDAAVRLLSFFNQLDTCSHRVILDFEEGPSGTMGYLNRAGFFDNLSSNVAVIQGRPTYSGAEQFSGTNPHLIEIARINYQYCDENLPNRMTNAIENACINRTDIGELTGAAWTIFAELIDNIFSHSETPLDGFAALQVYPKGNNLIVAVSDSGKGIMETLRPSLCNDSPALYSLSDIDLLVEVFRQGISRHGPDRGCGLKGSAAKAMKFKSILDIRLPKVRVQLTPGNDGYSPNTAYCYQDLPLIWGTHISFQFNLDMAS